MSLFSMKVSVIIPAKNEENSIGDVISGCRPFANEIIVVDGRSSDRTREVSLNSGAKVIVDRGKGKGDGIKTGIKNAEGDILVFIDADGSHEPGDMPRLIEPILKDKADMCIGSRLLGGSDEIHGTISNFMRTIGGGLITLAINYRWGIRLTDSQNGFRAIKRSVALSLGLEANDFDIEEEMILKALRKGYRLVEIPSHEYERKYGKSQLSAWKKGYKFIWRLLINLF